MDLDFAVSNFSVTTSPSLETRVNFMGIKNINSYSIESIFKMTLQSVHYILWCFCCSFSIYGNVHFDR